MERKLLQGAVVIAGFAGVFLGLTGVLFGTMVRQGRAARDRPDLVPLLWLWQRRVAEGAQRSAVT